MSNELLKAAIEATQRAEDTLAVLKEQEAIWWAAEKERRAATLALVEANQIKDHGPVVCYSQGQHYFLKVDCRGEGNAKASAWYLDPVSVIGTGNR